MALKSYHVLDTPPEPEFDDLAQVAARVCQTPIAAINLIADQRPWFKAEIGLGGREMPLDVSICAKVILQPGLCIIPDLAKDPRFDCNPLVTGKHGLRFYAGALLETSEGLPIGTLCILDYVPRNLMDDQVFVLQTLARQVMSQLELRRAVADRDQALAGSRRAAGAPRERTAPPSPQFARDGSGDARGHRAHDRHCQRVLPVVLCSH